jgi:hypothetical protein
MNIAKLPAISTERLCEELTRMVLVGTYPAGCDCRRVPWCPWCKNWPKVYRRIMRFLNRWKR